MKKLSCQKSLQDVNSFKNLTVVTFLVSSSTQFSITSDPQLSQHRFTYKYEVKEISLQNLYDVLMRSISSDEAILLLAENKARDIFRTENFMLMSCRILIAEIMDTNGYILQVHLSLFHRYNG